jgi:hypothetical protein
VLASLIAAVILAGAARPAQKTPSTKSSAPISAPQTEATVDPVRSPDEKVAQQGGGKAAASQRDLAASQSANLLKMATILKAEVDKSNKDTLSLAVIRQAEAIEHLAHNMRDRTNAVNASK